LQIGFGEPAANTQVVPDAIAALTALRLAGGRGIHFNGPASLYGYVACYDPKLQGYVVAISHDPSFRLGQLLPTADNR